MDTVIRFSKSAFKHGITEADIRWAIETMKYDGYLEDDEDMTMIRYGCFMR